MKPTRAQRLVLRGLARDPAKGCIDYDAPTDTAWQHRPVGSLGERVHAATFHALLRRGWIEERPTWTAPFGAVVYGISAAGLEVIR